MKYVWKNFKAFFTTDAYLMLLLIFTVMVSSMMIHFSYGLYINYYEEKRDNANELKDVNLDFDYTYKRKTCDEYECGQYDYIQPKGKTFATVAMMRKFAKQMSYELQSEIDEIDVEVDVDRMPIRCAFSIRNHEIVRSDKQAEEELIGNMTEGRYFTNEEYKKGARVAIPFSLNEVNVGMCPRTERLLADANTVLLQGKKYQVIGYGNLSIMDDVAVPITSLDADTPLAQNFEILFRHAIDRPKFEELKQLCENCFEGHVSIVNLNMQNVDGTHIGNTMILISFCIVLISMMNFAILYHYILEKRKRNFQIYRICGMRRRQAARNYFLECGILVIPSYGIGAWIFSAIFLPRLTFFLYYLKGKFSWKIYAGLFVLYFGVSAAVLGRMIHTQLKQADLVRNKGKGDIV